MIDGTGNPWFRADIAIEDGRIERIGYLRSSSGDRVINAKGLIVSPGFIDMHTHSDFCYKANPKAESKIRQGVTTEVIGNCGFSAAPISRAVTESAREFLRAISHGVSGWNWSSMTEYFNSLQEQGTAVNVAALVGHGLLRLDVMGFEDRKPTSDEMKEMKTLLHESLKAGAFGMSSGRGYPPGSFADTNELVELCGVLAEHGAIYTSDIGMEGEGLLEKVQEQIDIGERAGVPVEISHHKASGRPFWGRVNVSLKNIEDARMRGVDVTADAYPYTAGSGGLGMHFLPPWAYDGGTDRMLDKLKDSEVREKIIEESKVGWRGMNIAKSSTWDEIIITSHRNDSKVEGRTIAELAKLRQANPYNVVFDLVLESGDATQCVMLQRMSEDDVRKVICHNAVMVGSDGNSLAPYGDMGKGKPHPRSYGTYPRILAKFVREDKVLTLQEAIRKMTSFPAQKLGLRDRGILKEGMCADIVLFDLAAIQDKATFTDPHQYPSGIEYVIVNGEVVVDEGEHIGTLAGKVLHHQTVVNNY